MNLGVRKIGVLAAAFTSLILAGAFLAGTTAAGPSTDADSDGILDFQDNCLGRANGPAQAPNNQVDTNNDGYGNACDPDFTDDNIVGGPDLTTFRNNFGAANPDLDTDLTADNIVGGPDLTTFRNFFGVLPPGPSGHACAGTIPCPN